MLLQQSSAPPIEFHHAGNLNPRSPVTTGYSFTSITALGNCRLQCGHEIVNQRGILAAEGFYIFAAHRQHNAVVHFGEANHCSTDGEGRPSHNENRNIRQCTGDQCCQPANCQRNADAESALFRIDADRAYLLNLK